MSKSAAGRSQPSEASAASAHDDLAVSLFAEALTQRNMFAAGTFDSRNYVNRITERALGPGLPPSHGPSGAEKLDRKELDRDVARGVVHNTVDALCDALDAVVKLREAESENVEQKRRTCAEVEADQKARLTKLRGRADTVGGQLRDVEAQLTTAAALTSGIEVALEAASARAARGRNTLQLVAYFDALLAVEPTDLREQLGALEAARAEARQRAHRHWRLHLHEGRDAHVHPEALFSLPEANAGTVANAEQIAIGHGIPEELIARTQTLGAVELLRKLSRIAAGLKDRVPGNVDNVSAVVSWLSDQLVLDVDELLRAFYELFDSCAPQSARSPRAGQRRSSTEGEFRNPSHADPNSGQAATTRTATDDGEAKGTTDEAPAASEAQPESGESAPAQTTRPGRSGRGTAGSSARGRFVAAGKRASALAAFRSSRATKAATAASASSARASAVTTPTTTAEPQSMPTAVPKSLNELGLRSAYARQLLASLDLLTRLLTNLTGSSNVLRDFYVDRTIHMLTEDVRSFELDPLPPLAPPREPQIGLAMDVYPRNKAVVNAVFDFVRHRLQRESIVIQALFGADESLRHTVLSRAIDPVLREFIAVAQQASSRHSVAASMQEATMTPTSKRMNAGRYVDATTYHYAMHALLYDTLKTFAGSLPRAAIHEHVTEDDAFQGQGSSEDQQAAGSIAYVAMTAEIFRNREAFINDNNEGQLFDRLCQALTDEYASALAVYPDRAYDEVPEHMVKFGRIMHAAEHSVKRSLTLAPPSRHGAAVKHVAVSLATFVLDFVHDMLKRTHDSAKTGLQQLARRRGAAAIVANDDTPTEEAEGNARAFSHANAHHGAARMLLWAEVVLASLLRFLHNHIAPHYASNTDVASDVETAVSSGFERINSLSCDIATIVAQAIAIKALTVLKDLQEKTDYELKATDSTVGTQPTKAARAFAECLKADLDPCRRLIETFGAAAQEGSATGEALSGAGTSAGGGGGGHKRTISGEAPSASPGGSKHRRTTSLGLGFGDVSTPRHGAAPSGDSGTRADGLTPNELAAAAALSTVTTSAAAAALGGMSLGRLISTSLYHGIAAHIRQFSVSDAGSVVLKLDVNVYRQATAPLITLSKSSVERRIMSMQFDLLREVATLLMVPLDNIVTVRSTGLLRFLHKDEVTAYLRMRPDVRGALRAMA